jgi:hypothetical protein
MNVLRPHYAYPILGLEGIRESLFSSNELRGTFNVKNKVGQAREFALSNFF